MSWKTVRKDAGWKLKDKQRLYVAEYLVSFKGADAAEKAGYSKKSAADASRDLQRQPAVRAAIEAALEDREQELRDKFYKTMEHVYAQATFDMADCYDAEGSLLPLDKMPRERRLALFSVKYDVEWCDGKRIARVAKIQIHDKRASQELFAKYAGKLRERLEVDATTNFAELVLAAQRKREGTTEPQKPE